jgi:hypothetical protein
VANMPEDALDNEGLHLTPRCARRRLIPTRYAANGGISLPDFHRLRDVVPSLNLGNQSLGDYLLNDCPTRYRAHPALWWKAGDSGRQSPGESTTYQFGGDLVYLRGTTLRVNLARLTRSIWPEGAGADSPPIG